MKLITTITGLLLSVSSLFAAPVGGFEPQTSYSYIGKTKYKCTLSRYDVLATPDWTFGQSLPLSEADATVLARAELLRHTDDETRWQVTGVTLARLLDTTKWYYVVEFMRTMDSDDHSYVWGSVRVLVSFSKEAGRLVATEDP